MIKKIILTTFSCLILWACSKTDGNITKDMPESFPKQTAIDIETDEFPLIARAEKLFIQDSTILARVSLSEWGVYRIDYSTLEVMDSLCRIGQGPDEFIFPRIIPLNDDSLIVIDSSQKWFLIENDTITDRGVLPPAVILNSPTLVRYPYISGYNLNGNDCTDITIVDLEKSLSLDTLAIPKLPGNRPNNFFMDINPQGNKIVLAFISENKIMITDIDGNKFGKTLTLKGPSVENGQYYIGVVAGIDKIYVNSVKNVDLKTMEGSSSILVFDYDGNPIEEILLPVITFDTAINLSTGQAASMGDDLIYRFNIPE